MSTNCASTAQNCWDSCCDISGFCPASSADCYYYYSTTASTGLSTGAIAGIAVGIVIFIVIIALSSYCRRKRIQERMMRQRMMMSNMGAPNMMAANMMTPGMMAPMMPMNPIGPSYNPMTQQPPMNPLMPNPVMGQPMMFWNIINVVHVLP